MAQELSLAHALIENFINVQRSAVPVQGMFYVNQGCAERAGWHDLPQVFIAAARQAFATSVFALKVNVHGRLWTVDFGRMLLMRKESGCIMPITWKDARGNWFFPRYYVFCFTCGKRRLPPADEISVSGEGPEGSQDAAMCGKSPPNLPDLNLMPPESEVDE